MEKKCTGSILNSGYTIKETNDRDNVSNKDALKGLVSLVVITLIILGGIFLT